ncbi:MAG: hypothetical protein JWL84_3691 [Rhodospirillales bacterium]|jgi:hypothetical protein|nr:hypothetical protein [Rhodospirillales bacterium]
MRPAPDLSLLAAQWHSRGESMSTIASEVKRLCDDLALENRVLCDDERAALERAKDAIEMLLREGGDE